MISRVADRFELDLVCDFAKEVGITLHDYFVPMFTSNVIQLDSASSEFVVDMSLFLDGEMTEPMGEGHESKSILLNFVLLEQFSSNSRTNLRKAGVARCG